MKLLVVSDNHGDRYILSELIDIYQEEVDGMIHCGDSELPVWDEVWETMVTVKGNMDFTNDYPLTRVEEAFGEPVFVTHGHLHRVKSTLNEVAGEAKEAGARLAFYGHTHEPAIVCQSGIWIINPGSISQPRGENTHKTYAIVAIDGNDICVDYFDRDHNPLPHLSARRLI